MHCCHFRESFALVLDQIPEVDAGAGYFFTCLLPEGRAISERWRLAAQSATSRLLPPPLLKVSSVEKASSGRMLGGRGTSSG